MQEDLFPNMTNATIDADDLLKDITATVSRIGDGGYKIDIVIPKMEMTINVPGDVIQHDQEDRIPELMHERMMIDLQEVASAARVRLKTAIEGLPPVVAKEEMTDA